jgi:hypothetical protein
VEDNLAQYQAIILEPSWPFYQAEPGTQANFAENGHELLRILLSRRSTELPDFFDNYGVLFVALEEPVTSFGGYLSGEFDYDNYSWWLQTLRLPLGGSDARFLVTAGFGTSLQIREPGHPFETYLRLAGSYKVRINPDVSAAPSISILAENRPHQPVAIEMPVQSGSAILVPPIKDDGLASWFHHAVMETLVSRTGVPSEWQLAAERELQERRNQVLSKIRAERLSVEKQLAEVRTVKESLLKIDAVDRARTYLGNATSRTPTAGHSLPQLRKLIETVADRLGGEKMAAEKLGIPVENLKRINRLASDPRFDVVHPPQESVVSIDPAKFQRALKDGRLIFERLLEYEYAQATGGQPSYRQNNG